MAHNLLEIWDTYNTKVLNEKTLPKETAKFGKKPGKGPVQLNNPKAGEIAHQDTSGPDVTGNFDGPAFNRKIDDLKTMTPKDKADRPYVKDLNVFDVDEKFDKNIEKSTSSLINNYMKSTFNQLFEEVMGEDDKDLAALGVTPDAGSHGEEGMGEEITIKLSPHHIECLKEILSQCEGHGDETEGEVEMTDETEAQGGSDEEDSEEEDSEESEDDETMKEASGVQYKVTSPEADGKEVPDNDGLQLVGPKGKFNVSETQPGEETKKHMKAGAKKAGMQGFKYKTDAGSELASTVPMMTKVGAGSNVPKSAIKGNNQLAFGIST